MLRIDKNCQKLKLMITEDSWRPWLFTQDQRRVTKLNACLPMITLYSTTIPINFFLPVSI